MDKQSIHPFSAEAKQQAPANKADGPHHDNPPLPELRLVLLGRKGTGKSSSGNTILGMTGGFESGKPTEECVKRRADIASHRVTVVDTPGWEWYYSGNGTPAWVTRETMRSVTVCPPGPHALLLVIRSCAAVTEDYYNQVEEHLELLGKSVWAHTMLLFTRGEELGSIPIEQRMQNAGKSFQRLREKCGNRFHVLENKRCGKDGLQVKELIKKIEEMVKERGGRHYECDPLLLGIEVEGKRRARERRKKQRIMETQAQKAIIKAVLIADISSSEDLDEINLFSRGSRRLPELRLILLGERETGKSSAGNTILKGSAFFQTGQATEECSRQQAEISGRLVTVVDVPGWEGGPEGITPERVKREICASVALCPPGPHALLLTLRVDALVKATAVREHLELLGEGVWRHAILLFTRGDQLREGVTIEQHIQGGGRDLHWLMEKCGKRYHVVSSTVLEANTATAQVTTLLEKIEKMVSGNRCEAFSPVVQDIQELGKQKNERFNVKLKEVNDKLQRQELELKRMREREVKSIRRIFDWRKDKVKSPGKASKEREEGMDRTEDDRKSIMSELEERMTWLTEDREREIQELSLEHSRLIAALNQGYKEKGEVIMNLDEKERESEELKEKVDELQVNVLELKRIRVLKEQERKEREEELTKRHEDAENELKGQLDHKEKEVEELKSRIEEMQKTMAESKVKYEADILNEKQEKERKLAEKNELEKMVKEQQKEMEEIKQKTENKIREQDDKLREINEKRETEKNKLSEMIELMTKEMEELQVAFTEQVKSSDAARHIHENTVLKYNELVDKLVGKDAELIAIQQMKHEQEMAKNVEILNKLKEKDEEITELVKKHMEMEQEIEALKQSIDSHHRTMENVKNDSKAKMAEFNSKIKDLEKEYKEMEEFLKRENVIIKEEVDIMMNMNEENARKKDDETRKILEMKENIINHLQQQNEVSEIHKEDFKKQLKEVQVTVMSLQNQNATLIQELDGLNITCEDYKRELNAQKIKYDSREKEIKDVLSQSEEMGKIKDALNQENIIKREEEICLLQQKNYKQQIVLESMNEKSKELEKKIEELKKYYEERLLERIAEMDVKDAERERWLYNKELEVSEREQILGRNIEELERGKKDLKKRDDDINCREKELRDEKQQLSRKEHEIRDKENEIKYQCQNNQCLQENLERREKDLTERENEFESKNKKQMDFFKKQELERENIKKQLEDKENHLKNMEENLEIKQAEFKDQLKALECLRLDLNTRDKELNKREQQLVESEKLHEVKLQELSKAMQELEQNKQDIEKWQTELTTREQNLMQRLTECQKKENELLQSEHVLQIKNQDLLQSNKEIAAREQELLDKQEIQATANNQVKNELETIKDALVIREQELKTTKDKLDRREQELNDREKDLDMKEKQMIKKYEEYEAAEKILESKCKAQSECLEKQEKEIENIRQQLEEKEKELISMQDELLERQLNLQKENKDFEGLRENLNNRENELKNIEQELLNSKMLIAAREQEILNKQEIQATANNQVKNELETIKDALVIREQELRTTKDKLDRREQELKDREKDLDMKEKQMIQKYEEYEAAEKILESKCKAQNECSEKQEKEIENIRQQLEEKEKELISMQDELLVRQINLQKEKKDFEGLRENLNNRENELKNIEQELLNSKQLCEVKAHELSKGVQELEKSKEDNEKWQAELTNTEYDLLQRSNELQKKEEALIQRENDLQQKCLLRKNEEVEAVQQQLLSNQQNQMTEKLESQLEDLRETLAKREQELTKKENEFEKREQNIRSTEIYLNKREIIVQKREGDVQINKEQNECMLSDLKKKQEIIETKQHELGDLEKELSIRENNITNKEQDLSNRYKELDMKKHNMEKHELDLKSRDQKLKKTEQELNELNITLENQKSEINIEKQMLKMKSEQLEKWGKYLYNMELKMINSNPSPDFQPWNQKTSSTPTETRNSETMYQEVGIDSRIYDRENGNNSPVEDDQIVEMASLSVTTCSELENEELACLFKGKRAVEVNMDEDMDGADRQELSPFTQEDDVEEFFEPAVSDGQVNQSLFDQLSELKLMLIGEAWSSCQSATCTILGQDAKVSNPWRGNISGRPVLVVEPHGIKWRCSKDINMNFQKDLIHSVSLCTPGPHAFVLLLPAYLTFTGQYRRAVECTMASLGEVAWKHTIVLFTWAEALGESGQQHIKRNRDLEWLIQKCGGRYHVLDNRTREAHVVGLLEKIYGMVTANHGCYYQAQ